MEFTGAGHKRCNSPLSRKTNSGMMTSPRLTKSNGPQAETCQKLLKSAVGVIKARASTSAWQHWNGLHHGIIQEEQSSFIPQICLESGNNFRGWSKLVEKMAPETPTVRVRCFPSPITTQEHLYWMLLQNLSIELCSVSKLFKIFSFYEKCAWLRWCS